LPLGGKWRRFFKLRIENYQVIVLIGGIKFIKGENQRNRDGRKIFSNPSANNQPTVNFLNLTYSRKVGQEIEFSATTSNFATDTLIFN
jgi:hypothetical protein